VINGHKRHPHHTLPGVVSAGGLPRAQSPALAQPGSNPAALPQWLAQAEVGAITIRRAAPYLGAACRGSPPGTRVGPVKAGKGIEKTRGGWPQRSLRVLGTTSPAPVMKGLRGIKVGVPVLGQPTDNVARSSPRRKRRVPPDPHQTGRETAGALEFWRESVREVTVARPSGSPRRQQLAQRQAPLKAQQRSRHSERHAT